MVFAKRKSGLFFLLLLVASNVPVAFSGSESFPNLKRAHTIIQLGGYWSTQGQTQHVNIQGLIGDEFTVTNYTDSNALVGLGYFIDSQDKSFFKMSYGINAFYLAKTGVLGNVIQENLFTNLSYQYNLSHVPVYAIAKSTIMTKSLKYALIIDAGIGPNFIRANGFQEHALDGVTIPDNIFSGHRSTVFSATIGVGVEINQFFGSVPLECGYRFFYLGQGHFSRTTNQVLNNLNTGDSYANALICSIKV